MKPRSLVVVLLAALAVVTLAQGPGETPDRELFAEYASAKEQALVFTTKARRLFADALAQMKWNTDQVGHGLVGVVEMQLKLGDFRAAKATAAVIPQHLGFWEGRAGFIGFGPRDQALDIIAKAELENGNLDAAVSAASGITYQPPSGYEPGLKNDFPDRRGIIRAVIQKLTAERRYEDAVKVVRNLNPKSPKPAKSSGADRVKIERADFDLSETVSPLFGAMAADSRSPEARRLAKEWLFRSPFPLSKAMKAIALGQVRRGDVTGAKKWAEQFFEPDLFAILTGEMAAIQTRAGDADGGARSFKEAERRLSHAKEPWWLSELVASHAAAGNYAAALQLAGRSMKDGSDALVFAKETISGAAAKAGDFDEAKGIARTIRPEFTRVEALQEIAKLQAERGDNVGALETLKEAWKTTLSWRDHPSGGKKRLEILKAMSDKRGDADFGVMLNQAFEDSKFAIENPPKPYGGEQWQSQWGGAQYQLVEMQAKEGRVGEALVAAGEIKDSFHRQFAYGAIAVLQASKADGAGALKTLALVTDERLRGSRVSEVVAAHIKRGAFPEAKEAARLLSGRADSSEILYWGISVTSIVRALSERGEIAAAKATLAELAGEDQETVCSGRMIIAQELLNQKWRTHGIGKSSACRFNWGT